MATLSTVIATYHRPEALDTTIGDLLRQTVRPKQIIVVDNSGPEARRAPKAFQNVADVECVYLESPEVGRVNVARNEGLRRVNADFALLLDDDMRLPPDVLSNFLEVHAEGWDAVAGMVHESGGPLRVRGTMGRPFWRLIAHRHGTSKGHTIAVPSCFVSLRRTMIEHIGFLDEAFIYSYDDYDLGLRIWLNGFTLIQDPRPSAHHLKSPHGGSRQDLTGRKWMINKFTAKYYFVHKHFGRKAAMIDFITDVLWSAADHRLKFLNTIRYSWLCWKGFRLRWRYGRLPEIAPIHSGTSQNAECLL